MSPFLFSCIHAQNLGSRHWLPIGQTLHYRNRYSLSLILFQRTEGHIVVTDDFQFCGNDRRNRRRMRVAPCLKIGSIRRNAAGACPSRHAENQFWGNFVIKVIFCLRRLPGMSRGGFQQYWRKVHAPLVARHAGVLGIRRYVQSHTLDDPAFARIAATRGGASAYDGVAELWIEELGAPQSSERAAQAKLARR